jgi:hypothetical protein
MFFVGTIGVPFKPGLKDILVQFSKNGVEPFSLTVRRDLYLRVKIVFLWIWWQVGESTNKRNLYPVEGDLWLVQ